jgi:hypothetical protein
MIEGKRRDLPEDEYDLAPGEYGKSPDGKWYCRVPVEDAPGKYFGLGALGKHQVIEHEDGTITVSPSILISHWEGRSWHGYLERGVWREV